MNDSEEFDARNTSDEDDLGCPGPSKRSKLGSFRYKTRFNKAWLEKYPFISEVVGDVHSFYCSLCKRKISCAIMGKHDIERHVGTAIHESNVKAARTQTTLSFPSFNSSLMEKVLVASEVLACKEKYGCF